MSSTLAAVNGEALVSTKTELSMPFLGDDSLHPSIEIQFKKIPIDNHNADASNGTTASAAAVSEPNTLVANDCKNVTEIPTNGSMSTNNDEQHDSDIFRPSCVCRACLHYRESVVLLFLEDLEYNKVLKSLQTLLRQFYRPFICASATKDEILQNWSGDGNIMDNRTLIRLPYRAKFPLAQDSLFLVLFAVLQRRDVHQIFEILCQQLRVITVAYSKGLLKILKMENEKSTGEAKIKPTYDPIELLNYILDGYEKICSVAASVTPLLVDLNETHLNRFGLTWNILNKRMYQRYVYWDIKDLMPECILRLKTLLDTDKYKELVLRFIKFDDEMTLLSFKWREIWNSLNSYHMERADIERRLRQCSVSLLLERLKCYKYVINDTKFNNAKPRLNWRSPADREKVWEFTMYCLINKWNQTLWITRQANVSCMKCNSALATHSIDCTCRTCIIGGGGPCFSRIKETIKRFYCNKCTVYEKLDQNYLECVSEFIHLKRNEAIQSQRHVNRTLGPQYDELSDDEFDMTKHDNDYHLSWAVFKQLPNRQIYIRAEMKLEHFCFFKKPCKNIDCVVAKQIIAAVYPKKFAKLLLKVYQPIGEDDRKDLLSIQRLYFTYLVNKLYDENSADECAVDIVSDEKCADYALLCDMVSTFSECYIIDDLKLPSLKTLQSFFKKNELDLQVDMQWFDKMYESLPPVVSADDIEDVKLKYLNDIRCHMHKFFLDRASLEKALIKEEEKLFVNSIDAELSIKTSHSVKQIVCDTIMDIELREPKLHPECNCLVKHNNSSSFENIDPTSSNSASNKDLNFQLDEEIVTLKEEHSPEEEEEKPVLRELVKDLEQMKEMESVKKKQQKPTTGSATVTATAATTTAAATTPAEKNGHTCCSEHFDMLDNNPHRMCFRSDGQCTCYYCTMFGHAVMECNHGRNNETRDRLRKRLHQQHSRDSSKSSKSSNPSTSNHVNVLKKSSTIKPMDTNNITPNKANERNAQIENAFINIQKTMTNTLSNEPANTKRKLYNPVDLQTQNVLGITEELERELKSLQKEKQMRVKKIEQLKRQTMDAMKAAPQSAAAAVAATIPDKHHVPLLAPYKTKSKIQKIDLKEILERDKLFDDVPDQLVDIVSEKIAEKVMDKCCGPVVAERQPEQPLQNIQDILEYIEGGTSKEYSMKKAAKKAKQKRKRQDIKKIEVLEKIKEDFHEIFFKESDHKKELKTLRTAKKKDKKKITEAENNAKKYGKLRAKVENDILQLIAELKRSNSDFKFSYLPTKEEQLEKQKQESVLASLQSLKLTNKESNQVQPQQEPQQQQPSPPQQQPPTEYNENQPNCEISLDPSKRMVTIRRVNVPHADPQVTVTAKGPSPDKDKLLYTFINGQLVTANSADASTLNATQLSQVQQYQLQHQQLRQQNLNAALNNEYLQQKQNKKSKPDAKVAPPPPNVVQKPTESNGVVSKTQKKKDKKAKKLQEKEVVVEEPPQAQQELIDTKCPVGESKKKETKLPRKLVDDAPQTKREVKKKIKLPKYEYADPDYKNNKFDVLDLDDDDCYVSDDATLSAADDDDRDDDCSIVSAKPTVKLPQQNSKKSKSKDKPNDFKVVVEKAKAIKSKVTTPVEQPKQLSKKQQKKLAQATAASSKNVQKPIKTNSSSLPRTDNLEFALNKSMQKLHLNDDTTIELIKENHGHVTNSQATSNVSIMDQLNLGIKVEGLMLPPGITLTRVDPNTADAIKAKKESIGRICHPMKQEAAQDPQHVLMSNPTNGLGSSSVLTPMNLSAGLNPNGFIMVDTLNIQNTSASSASSSKKNKKNRKKNKLKNDEAANVAAASAPKLVTLRNPLFQGAVGQQPMRQPINSQMPLNMDRPAAIIKNKNGMFTIRNPALQQALSNNVPNVPNVSNYKQFGYDQSFTAGAMHDGNASVFASDQPRPKPTVAIGSEVKSAKKKKQMELQQQQQQQQQSNHIPPPFGYSLGAISKPQIADNAPQQFYNGNGFGGGSAYSNDSNECKYLFGNSATHNCVDELSTRNSYYDGVPAAPAGNTFSKKYDDNAFLHNLQPGQRLNSEVTIHNISESKYHRGQSAVPNGVEITRVPGPLPQHQQPQQQSHQHLFQTQPQQHLQQQQQQHPLQPQQHYQQHHNVQQQYQQQPPHNYSTFPNLAVGSHRHGRNDQMASSSSGGGGASGGGEFGDSIFAPNQTVNLSELESEERDIESFKRFNYYFEPPKNKPKVNFNVKDIVLTKKMPNAGSPFFGESTAGSNLDQLYNDMNTLKLSNNYHANGGGGGGVGGGSLLLGNNHLFNGDINNHDILN